MTKMKKNIIKRFNSKIIRKSVHGIVYTDLVSSVIIEDNIRRNKDMLVFTINPHE